MKEETDTKEEFTAWVNKEERIVTAATEYSTYIHASVEKDNIFACQFHPEKSSRIGLKILQNFVDITKEYRDQHTQGGQ